MVTEIELFLRKRIENDVEFWDVAESEVKAPLFNLDVDKFNSNIFSDEVLLAFKSALQKIKATNTKDVYILDPLTESIKNLKNLIAQIPQ